MRLDEIKEKVIKGELILVKTPVGTKHTRRYIFNDKNECTGVKKFEYRGWMCRAEYPDNHSGYRISQKVWKELLDCVSCTNNIIKKNDSNKV